MWRARPKRDPSFLDMVLHGFCLMTGRANRTVASSVQSSSPIIPKNSMSRTEMLKLRSVNGLALAPEGRLSKSSAQISSFTFFRE